MEKMVAYYHTEQFIVVHINDEAEFLARYFGETPPDWEIWERMEFDGPVVLETPSPEISSVYDSYDV